MPLNLFYYSPIDRKTVSIELKNSENVDDLSKIISSKESISENEFKLYSNGKRLESTKHLINDSVIGLHFCLNGGKGGFGSMLRAIGAQIEKTTNREACRDLTGRRLRDINEEKRIKEWIKREKLRKDEIDERKRQKLQKLAQKPKTEFNDLDFERTRDEIPDIVDEALQYGLQVQQKGEQSTSSQKRKSEEQTKSKLKRSKTSLWIGDDIDIEDDSDDNEGQTINEEEDSTKDSVVSNNNSNDTEITIDSKTIDNESEEQQQESEETEEVIVQQSESITEPQSTSTSVSKESSEPSVANEAKQTEAKDKELTPGSSSDSSFIKKTGDEPILEPLNLMEFESLQQLKYLGLDRLKHALMALGLKCGGTLNERADRLWSTKGLDFKDIPKKLLAKKK